MAPLAMCAWALVCWAASAVARETSGSKPNVLIFFADDLGVGDLGCYGNPVNLSPNLDRLANTGVRFTAWYSGFHICSPSRAAMLTGRLCVRSGTCGSGWKGGVFSNKPVGGLPTNETTFGTAVKQAGYRTAAIGKWHLGTKSEFMPTNHGFDEYFGVPYSCDMGRSAWSPNGEFPPLPLVHSDMVIEQPTDLNLLSTRYATFADDFIKSATAASVPWLLYLAFNHVHTPDFVSPKFCGTTRRGVFGDALAELDWVVGQVLSSVANVGQTDQTIVFVSSDNGPWTDKGLAGGTAGPFRDGKGSVWEGGVREPGIVSWPGTIAPRVESEPVATYDIFPTVLKLAGVDFPDRTLDGRDMMPLLLDSSVKSAHDCIFYWKGCSSKQWCGVPEDSPLINRQNPGLWAVRCGAYKTHFVATNVSCSVHYMPDGIYQEEPLIYRIDEDPSERFPLNPIVQKAEYSKQLAVARVAIQNHINSLSPVPNQIALGSDAIVQQKGGAAFCCAAGSANATCNCNSSSMHVFVCSTNNTDFDRKKNDVGIAVSHSDTVNHDAITNTEKPNVIMFFVDDSGYADFSVYGAPSTHTPHINQLAAEGARFTQWYSAHAICTPSRAALMTGRLPIRFGLASTSKGSQSVFTCQSRMGIPATEITLAELLKSAGYRTAMVGKWHLGHLPPYLPTAHGFDTYFGVPFSVDMGFAYNNRTEESWSGSYYGCSPLPLLANTTVIEQPVDLSTIHSKYTSAAIDFVTSSLASGRPFFLYHAFGHVHTPQFAGPLQSGKSKRGIFGDSVAEVDAAVGEVMTAVRDTNTLVILSSDNGAPDSHQHLQPGELLDAVTGSNWAFVGAKTQTWEGGLREPGVLWWPSGGVAPQVRREVTSTLDVFATVAEAAKLALPTDRKYDSVSMLPLVRGSTSANAVAPRNVSFFYAGSRLQAVRIGSLKAHLFTEMPSEPHAGPERNFLVPSHNDHSPYGIQSPWLFFDVERDPSEMYDCTHHGCVTASDRQMFQQVVNAHLADLGTPPQGVLDVLCAPGEDCRICCDHAKSCMCSPPPHSSHAV